MTLRRILFPLVVLSLAFCVVALGQDAGTRGTWLGWEDIFTSPFWVAVLAVVIVQALVCASLSFVLASIKGRNPTIWFAVGLFCGLLGLIAAAGLPDRSRPEELRQQIGSAGAAVQTAEPKSARQEVWAKEDRMPKVKEPEQTTVSPSPFTFWLVVLGIVGIIGGAVLFRELLPGQPQAGYEWKFAAYLPAVTWLVAGIAAGFFCLVAAAVVQWVRDIRDALWAIQRQTVETRPTPKASTGGS